MKMSTNFSNASQNTATVAELNFLRYTEESNAGSPSSSNQSTPSHLIDYELQDKDSSHSNWDSSPSGHYDKFNYDLHNDYDEESDYNNYEDLLDVNLSQSYLNDNRLGALLERRPLRPSDTAEFFPRYSKVARLTLAHNQLTRFPDRITHLKNLVELDLSNNNITSLPDQLGALTRLRVFAARNNQLSDLPKAAGTLIELQTLNLSGNWLTCLPSAVLEMQALVELQLGGNRIVALPPQIAQLEQLEILYLGGNRLTDVPAAVGRLTRLTSLVLADNRIETLPASISNLRALQSLTLHNNRLRALPNGLARLPHLEHLSLRNNPLVTSFAKAIRLEPPTLKEMAARVITVNQTDGGALVGVLLPAVYASVLPRDLHAYLASANRCVNPRCRGVYFESCAELVKFVDFCGKYRVPLMQYLCSPHCTQTTPTCAYNDNESYDDERGQQSEITLNDGNQREFVSLSNSRPSTSRVNSSASDGNDANIEKILLG